MRDTTAKEAYGDVEAMHSLPFTFGSCFSRLDQAP